MYELIKGRGKFWIWSSVGEPNFTREKVGNPESLPRRQDPLSRLTNKLFINDSRTIYDLYGNKYPHIVIGEVLMT